MAYLSAMKYYFKPIRELPAEKGFSDIVLLPRIAYMELPVLLIELTWNKSTDKAIQQVKDKNYTRTLESYSGNI